MASAAVSVLMGHLDDAVSIAVAVTIVVSVAFVQEYRSEKSLEELNKLVPPVCHCLRDNSVADLLAKELVPGDIILINVGDRIPADCRLIEAVDLEVDESSLTGETHAVCKHILPIPDAHEHPIAERRNLIYMGTLVTAGRGRAVVFGTGKHSEFGAVFEVMQSVEERKTPLQHRMDTLGKQVSIFSFAVIGIIVLLGLLQGRQIVKMFQIGVSLAVAAIPEGLPICVTVTLALGVMRMAKKHAILKKLPAVEALGCTNIVCVDKTGTITQNEMTVCELYAPFESVTAEVSGLGYGYNGEVTIRNEIVTQYSHPHIYNALLSASLCSNAKVHDKQLIGQPTEGALVVCAMKLGITNDILGKYERVAEVPFSSEKKWMATCCESKLQSKKMWCVKGMVEAVVPRCDKLENNTGQLKPLCSTDREHVLAQSTIMASRGLRVLAIAYGDSMDEGLVLGGIVGIFDPPRQGAAAAISRLAASGVRTVMLTGDSKDTAVAIGERLGIFTDEVDGTLSGTQVDAMSLPELEAKVVTTSIFYRTCPRHKLKIVQAYQEANYVVAMTGDGVNDAPALKAADIGIAMGTSTDVSKEAADMILVDDNFATIICAMEEGKSIFHNIKNFLRFQLSTSVAALSLITLSTLFDLPNPLNAMQILWINIIMDGPPAQSLGVEPVDPDVMRENPRSKDSPIITTALIKRVIVSAANIVSGTLFVFYQELERGNDGEYIVTRRDRTVSFTTFVLFDMFNALSCRSDTKSVFDLGLFKNKAFVLAVSGSLIGQLLVIYFPPLQNVFQTEQLSLYDLMYILIIASSVFVVDECRKYHLKKKPFQRVRRMSGIRKKDSISYEAVV